MLHKGWKTIHANTTAVRSRLPTIPDSSLYACVLVGWRGGEVQQRPRPWQEVVVWVLGVDSSLKRVSP